MSKSFALLMVGIGLLPLTSFASDTWQCDGDNIEGAGITETRHGLAGDVQWDCLPGGAICTQSTPVQRTTGADGEAIYEGSSFKLVINIAHAEGHGEYHAKISARDMTDDRNEGRGLTIRKELTCQNK